METKETEEKKRLEKSCSLQAENLKAKFMMTKIKMQNEENNKLKQEILRLNKEKEKSTKDIKDLIIKNIENIFSDKIEEVKEKNEISKKKSQPKALEKTKFQKGKKN